MIKNKMPKMPKIFKHWRKVDNVLLIIAILMAVSYGINQIGKTAYASYSMIAVSTNAGEVTNGQWTPSLYKGIKSESVYDITNTAGQSYTGNFVAYLSGNCGDYATIYWATMDNVKVDGSIELLPDTTYQYKLVIDIAEDCPTCDINYTIGIQ